MSDWPQKYHCAERTLDIILKDGITTARIWFDGRSDRWNMGKLRQLTTKVRDGNWEDESPEALLDFLATLPAVHAVQVTRDMADCKIGIMAYTVPFESGADIANAIQEHMERNRG